MQPQPKFDVGSPHVRPLRSLTLHPVCCCVQSPSLNGAISKSSFVDLVSSALAEEHQSPRLESERPTSFYTMNNVLRGAMLYDSPPSTAPEVRVALHLARTS